MREPVDLSAVYTGVKLLNSKEVWQYEVEALEDSFRQTRLRGYSFQHSSDEKHSGISIANQKQYLMVLGGPGAGKSTFLRKVGLEALRTFYYERAEYSHRLIPVLIELKRFEANELDIAKFIATEFETCGFPGAETFTQNALIQGNLLILLDGLDEVPSANLNKVLQTIRDFIDRYDDNRFIASCRVAASGYRADAFRRFSDVTMADFDDEQIQQFVRNWFGSAQDVERNKAGKCWEALQKSENKASKELAHTPLLLTHLCLVYDRSQRFPNNRSSLHEKALRILLEEWAADKSILRDEIYEGLSIEQEEILLSEIAYKGMAADQLFFTKRELSTQIKDFLSSNLNAPRHLDSEAVLNAIEVQQGILVERAEDTYSFSHLTLQEYLTAQYLIDNNEWEALVQQRLIDSRWRDIFLLLPGLTTGKVGANRILLALEKQANKYLHSSKLQQLIQWAEFSTNDSAENIKPSVKKAFVIFLACSLSVDLTRSLALVFGQSLGFDYMPPELRSAISLAHSLGFDFNFDPARYLDHCIYYEFGFDFSLTHSIELERVAYFSRTEILNHCDFDELIQKIERVEPNINDINFNGAQFLGNLYGLWFSTLGIEAETATLSKEESQSLAHYLYACELMVRCQEGAVRVSPDVWAGIESRILTVPNVSKAAAD